MRKKLFIFSLSVLWTLNVFSQYFSRTFTGNFNSNSYIWQLAVPENDIYCSLEKVCNDSSLCVTLSKFDNKAEVIYSRELTGVKGLLSRMLVRNDTIFYCSNHYDAIDSTFYWKFGLVSSEGENLLEYTFKTLHLRDVAIGSFGYLYPNVYGLTLVNNNEVILWGEGLDNRQPNPGKVPYRSVFLRVGLDGSRKGEIFWFDVNDEKPRRMSDATTDLDGNMVFHYEWRNKINNGNVNFQKRGIFKILPNDSIINIAHLDVGQLDQDLPKIAIDKNGNYFINTLEAGYLSEYNEDAWEMTYLSKINRNGTEVWRKLIPPYKGDFWKSIATSDFEMRRISTTKNGDVLCTGRLSVLDSFYRNDLGKSIHLSSLYCSFIARFDTDGNLLWRHIIVPHKKDGSIRNNYIYDIQEAADGSIITGGQLERDDDVSGRLGDAWLMRLSPDGCLNDSCDHIGKYWDFPSEIVSVSDGNVATNLTIYPNPGHDHINITLPANLTLPIRYQINDMQGRTHETGTQNQHDVKIDAAYLPSGMFNILIQDKTGKIWHGRWVKGE